MEITVRNATEADFPEIQKVAHTAWKKAYKDLIPTSVQEAFLAAAYSPEQLQHKLAGTTFFVGEIDNKVVGFANLHRSETENDLSAIYVHPAFQANGVGGALLTKVINALQPGDTLVVYLEKGNHQAESFYRKHGFTYIETFQETILHHPFQTMKMSKGVA